MIHWRRDRGGFWVVRSGHGNRESSATGKGGRSLFAFYVVLQLTARLNKCIMRILWSSRARDLDRSRLKLALTCRRRRTTMVAPRVSWVDVVSAPHIPSCPMFKHRDYISQFLHIFIYTVCVFWLQAPFETTPKYSPNC